MKSRTIDIPPHVYAGIRHRSSGFPNEIRFFSGDVETCKGHPITLQLADNPVHGDIYFIDKETILPTFVEWIRPRLRSKQVNVCFFHYLAHDLPALLYNQVTEFSENQFNMEYEGIKISVLAAKIFYAKFVFPDKTTLHIIDSFRFYTTSLAKIGKTLNCMNVKFAKPKGLGKKRFLPSDKAFVDYALQDALLGWEVGEHIINMHKEFDVPLSISAPQFAARVFTRYYLKPGEVIKLPNKYILSASLNSYHGGKNGFYVKPGLYRNVTELDISSAYPNAMRKLPQFVSGRYEYVNKYDNSYVGVYQINGYLKKCRYSIFLTHDGKAISGPAEIKDLWVTSYELEEALRTNEFELVSCVGWRWNPTKKYPSNPLADYVDKFYHLKETSPKGNPEYLTYKLLMNSLYGKFIQNVETDSEGITEFVLDADGKHVPVKKKKHKAGGLFNPFIATLITGEVRAYLHRLEHQYEAVHASTDSIKTLAQIDPASLPLGLGGLNVEITGDCVLLRNKLYLHYEGAINGVKPKKWALHGFWGDVDALLELVRKKETKYTVEHLYKVREALRQRLVPLRTYTQKREVQIEWENYQEDVSGLGTEKAGGKGGVEKVHEAYWLQGESGEEDARAGISEKGG